MKKNKMMTISVVLVMALAFSGIAYAHWYDQVHIMGITHGGTVNLSFDDYETPTYVEKYLDANGQLQNGEYLGKDVGSGTALYDPDSWEYDVHSGKEGYSTIDVNIECAYPGYRAHIVHVLHNIGTIPINLCTYQVTGEKRLKSDNSIVHVLLFKEINDPFDFKGELYEDTNDNLILDDGDTLVINVVVENGEKPPYQIDPCNDNKQEFDLHFKQDCQQCHRYTIHLEALALQWNKDCDFFDDYPFDG
jgi:hypothetical protein